VPEPPPPAGVLATRRSPGSYRIELGSGGRIEVGTEGPRSVDLVLAGLAACSGRTLDQILRRMRLEVAGVELTVRGERRPEPPEILTRVELTWRIAAGSAPAHRVRRAIELCERHCPVLAMLRAATPVEVRLEMT